MDQCQPQLLQTFYAAALWNPVFLLSAWSTKAYFVPAKLHVTLLIEQHQQRPGTDIRAPLGQQGFAEWRPNIQLLISCSDGICSCRSAGAGKSSLMRVLAGQDSNYEGQLQLADGMHIGYLEQEPKLDDGPTVEDNIRPALARVQSLLDEYNQVRLSPCGPHAASVLCSCQAILTVAIGFTATGVS